MRDSLKQLLAFLVEIVVGFFKALSGYDPKYEDLVVSGLSVTVIPRLPNPA